MKRFLSVILSVCMLLASYPALAAEYAEDEDAVFYINFDEELPQGAKGYYLSILNEGVYGNAAWFNGSSSYIQLPENITKGVTDFTMAAWVNVTSTTKGWQRFIDLGNGTASYAFLGIPYTTTDIRGAVKVNNGSENNVTAAKSLKKNVWTHVAFVQSGNKATLYINGVAAGTTDVLGTLDAMGNTATNYIGRSQFTSDPYYKGYLDEIVFAKRAFSQDEIADMAKFPETVVNEETILAAIDILGKESIKENIALQKNVLGCDVVWESEDEEIIYPYDISNGDYTIPAGKVTRGEQDKTVNLTASVEYEGKILKKTIPVTVKAQAEPVGETAAYLYVYFRGNVNGSPENLSIHLAASEDGYNWYDLNGNWPILESNMGTQCLRDPYLIRSVNGDRFYLIATDLDTQDGQGWGPWSNEGSKHLMVWESDDLVNWSEQRMIKFANDDIGCAWAPEATWDPDTGEYLVYASGKDLTMENPGDTVYVVRTRDFRTFSEPEYFLAPVNADGSRAWAIDSNIIQGNDGKFYMFYKHANSVINMLVSDHASGPWEEVEGFESIGGEGPGSFLVKGTDDTYALMVDNYSVYVPYLTKDLASGKFTKAADEIRMPTGSKHGGFLPINAEEYARVLEKYGSPVPDEEGSGARLAFDFESGGSEYLNGNAKIEYNEERESNTLVLDGSNGYLEFPAGTFDRRDAFTLSFDVLNNNSPANAMAFSLGTSDSYYYFYKTNDNEMRSALTITGWQYEEKAVSSDLGDLNNKWMHIDLVVDNYSMKIYKDAALVAENNNMTKTISHLGLEGLNAYLGKSPYAADPYFKGEFDNVKLFYRALEPSEIAYAMGYTSEDLAKLDAESLNLGFDVNYVIGDISLPQKGVYGSSITWTSEDESIVSDSGKVVVPADESGIKTVKMTAVFNCNGAEYVKEYYLAVKPAMSYLVSTVEGAWKTYDIPVADKTVKYTFNIKADQVTDGGVAFASSTATPNAYGNYRMFMRMTPDGYFDAYNGTFYAKVETVNYEPGKVYPVTIEANIEKKTYSVYVDVDGVRKTVAKDYAFRTSGLGSDVGKLSVYAGYGTEAGHITVMDFKAAVQTDIAITNVTVKDGMVSGSIVSDKDLGESSIIAAAWNEDGVLTNVNTIKADIKSGETTFEIPVNGATVKVMLWNSVAELVPYAEAVEMK